MLQKDKKTNAEVVLPNTGRHPAKDESLIGELPADCNHDRWLQAANPKNVVALYPVEKKECSRSKAMLGPKASRALFGTRLSLSLNIGIFKQLLIVGLK